MLRSYVELKLIDPDINAMPTNPAANHLVHFRRNLVAAGVGANLVTDAHVAAVAMEYQAEVHERHGLQSLSGAAIA